MKKAFLFTLMLLTITSVRAQTTIIEKVMKNYSQKWPKTISFTQNTTFYTPTGETKQTWYEAGAFPEKFRIDFDREKGNAVIFNDRKEFYFKEHQLSRTGANNNPLIYLLGGMYFEKIDTVKSKLSKLGINMIIESDSTWKGRNILILGATKGDTTKSQLWFDSKNLYLVRFINNNGNSQMDVHFSGQKKIGSTWHEMIVDIFQNGKLKQKEEYFDFKTNIKLNEAIFDPHQFGKIHWLN